MNINEINEQINIYKLKIDEIISEIRCEMEGITDPCVNLTRVNRSKLPETQNLRFEP